MPTESADSGPARLADVSAVFTDSNTPVIADPWSESAAFASSADQLEPELRHQSRFADGMRTKNRVSHEANAWPELITIRGQNPDFFAGGDPFNQPPGVVIDPYTGLPGGGFMYGANAPEPYDIGWKRELESTFMPASLTNAGDRFQVTEVDFSMENVSALQSGTMFRWTPSFGLRLWDGPLNRQLPSQAYRFASDFEWSTPQQGGPWSAVIGFTPSINSDLDQSPSSDAFNWDGRAYFLYQMNPQWRAMIGVQYWDRLDDYFVPHAGFIYTDDIWEMRLTFPEARLSLFVGNELGCAKWLYLRGEYNVESYEIALNNGSRDQVEFTDFRAMIGSRMDTGRSSFFFEGGWVFGRSADFRNQAGFDVKTNFLGRVGIRF